MTDVLGFIFGLITAAMALLGLFAIFKSITDENDKNVANAFKEGLEAGLRMSKGGETKHGHISEKTLTTKLKKKQ